MLRPGIFRGARRVMRQGISVRGGSNPRINSVKTLNTIPKSIVDRIVYNVPLLIHTSNSSVNSRKSRSHSLPKSTEKRQHASHRQIQQEMIESKDDCDPHTIIVDNVRYERGKQIGKGAFKFIYEACSPIQIKNVTKNVCSSSIVISQQLVTTNLDKETIRRELFFSEYLGQLGLAPRVYHSSVCNNQVTTLVERMDYNAYDLGKRQSFETFGVQHGDTFPVLLYTVEQFGNMIQVIIELCRLGIRHGDLKIENIMFINGVCKLIDFGYSGDYTHFDPLWGFTYNYGCPSDEPISSMIDVQVNFWQFFRCLIGEVFVFIHDPIDNQLYLLDALDYPNTQNLLNPQTVDTILQTCTAERMNSQLVHELVSEKHMRQELLSHSGTNILAFRFHTGRID